jgi:ribosome-associated toxin RatA of RatAB toxin-antitoxin module
LNAARLGSAGPAVLGLLLGLLLGLALLTGVATAGKGGSSFTDAEWRKLQAGQLVFRKQESRRGGLELVGGSSWQVIDAPPSAVFRALLDTRRYHKMMPQVIEARLVTASDAERTVFMRQGTKGLLERSYYLRVNVDEDKQDITFVVDDKRPRDLRAAWGFYTVRPFDDGRTLLAYGILADLGDGLVASLMRNEVQDWMLKTPFMVKRFLEGSGKKLYR